jgi:hypothetical protein
MSTYDTVLVKARNSVTGAPTDVSLSKDSLSVLTSPVHGRYAEAVLRGNVYVYANAAAVTTTAVLTSTYTGLAIGNPLNSPKYLSILQAGFGQHAAAAAGVVGLATCTQVIAASLIPKNKLTGVVGGSVAVASASFSITNTATIDTILGSTGSVATTAYGTQPPALHDIGGLIMIAPGNAVLFYTSVVTTSALIFCISWEEIPI